MRLKRLLDRRAINSLAALGLLLGTVAPAALPAFASAAQLSSRSITMSTSATGATAQYDIKFTAPTSIAIGGGVAIEFCSDSAVTGDVCTRPVGMDTSTSAAIVDVKTNDVSMTDDGTLDNNGPDDEEGSLLWTAAEAHTGGNTLEIIVSGIVNPSGAGVFYARIMTFANGTQLSAYTGEQTGEFGTYADEGSVALAATAGVGITSYVLESMSFCVSRGDVGNSGTPDQTDAQGEPAENCGNGVAGCPATDGCVVAPSMTLGDETYASSGIYALNSSTFNTGKIWAQLSSNASGTTVVNLKSDATSCGGLYRNGNPANCNITPQTTTGDPTPSNNTFTAGQAKFGLTVGTADVAPDSVGGAGSGSGTGNVSRSGNYSDTDYYINYVAGNGSGVTGPYGDPVFTASGAVDNVNVPITFGTSITNNTPAGVYGATLSLIAVGTF